MKLGNGTYRTKAGSTLTISGKHSGIAEVEFDWLEEGACCDCQANAYPDDDGFLTWDCDECGGGKAELRKTWE
jgi:hypothetical protein